MLFEIILIGGFWFWLLIAFEFVALTVCVENEYPGWCMFWSIILIAALALFSDFNLLGYIWENPMSILYMGLAYIGVGLGWSFCKFYFYMARFKREYRARKEAWLEEHPGKDTTDFIKSESSEYYDYKVPEFRDIKEKIIFWTAYWPMSMFWTILNDPLMRLCENIIELFSGIYKRIYKSVLKEMLFDKEQQRILQQKEQEQE